MTAVEEFWGENQVAERPATHAESLAQLERRREMFPELERLMPTYFPGKTILDYGCGPGHDTLQFLLNGARRVYYADVSERALRITADRLRLAGLFYGQRWKVRDNRIPLLPFVDHVHCAGVLHHLSNPEEVLRSFRVSLRPGHGECRLMVYDGDRSEHTQSDVPITNWWGFDDVMRMAAEAGFDRSKYHGSYECSAPWRPNCYAACYVLR